MQGGLSSLGWGITSVKDYSLYVLEEKKKLWTIHSYCVRSSAAAEREEKNGYPVGGRE